MPRQKRAVPNLPSRNRCRSSWAVATGCLAVFASCRGGNALTLRDSEGRSFLCQRTGDRVYALTQKSGPGAQPASDGEPTKIRAAPVFRLQSTGRVVGVCGPVDSGGELAPSDCRPVVCESDRDCPASEGLSSGVCINQLCVEPSHAVNSDDAVMLCLAGTGLLPRTATQVERLALGLNCGTPCRVPRPCRQP
jgi:hypothetical protein